MPADLVLVNGTVFTSDPTRPVARGVALTGGAIAAVGMDPDVTPFIGSGTRVVDLRGRMVCAGFQDAHVHPVHGGLGRRRCDVSTADGWGEAAGLIGRYAEANPASEWVLGRGWAYAWFDGGRPAASLLDGLTGGRPAYLVGADGHSGWANSAALARAGIDADTPDPEDGRIERLADGRPQGTLHEGAMNLVERVVPPDTPADIEAALVEGQSHLLSLGITAWQDAWVTDEIHAAYRSLAAAGQLRARVRASLWWDREAGIDQIERLVEARAGSTGPYRATSVKLMLDGVCENLTASMSEPYLAADGAPSDVTGLDFIDPDELREIVTALDAAGFQCHFHAIGDAAVHHALDAVERARVTNGWSDLRHHVAHIQVVDPSDIPRFHELGVVANAQTVWAYNDPAMTDLTLPVLGARRAGWQYPFGSLHRAGASLAMGSDWPVTTADVLAQMSVAVRRLGPGGGPEIFLPSERLALGVALTAFTAGSSFVNGFEADSGSVVPGKRGDLVVLADDLFDLADPAESRVDLTIVEGEVVYER